MNKILVFEKKYIIIYMENFKPNNEAKKETVMWAAVKYKGKIFEALLHVDAVNLCLAKFPDMDWSLMEEGYVTSEERFVTREEANELIDAERDPSEE
jgi:hypothetical protein